VLFIDAPAKCMSESDVLELLERKNIGNDILFVLDTSTPSIENDMKMISILVVN
jgi:Mg-chelatase subunit ChlD